MSIGLPYKWGTRIRSNVTILNILYSGAWAAVHRLMPGVGGQTSVRLVAATAVGWDSQAIPSSSIMPTSQKYYGK